VIVTYFLPAAVLGLSRISRTPCIHGVDSEGVNSVARIFFIQGSNHEITTIALLSAIFGLGLFCLLM